MTYPKLLADIGGTNARFALETAASQLHAVQVLACADYPTLSDAIRSYLASTEVAECLSTGAAPIRQAGIAIANPVTGDVVQMTNHHWSFSISGVRDEFGFQSLRVVNDFTALAMSLPFLSEKQKFQVGGGAALDKAALGLLGAGTGLGVSGLLPCGDSWIALDSEGGHATFAPSNECEMDILRFAWREFPHVSAERFLSGAGLNLIYRALAARQGQTADALEAPEILKRGMAQECALCMEVLERFCDMLGTAASSLAVTLGARGGIYIGGGIVPRLGDYLRQSGFRRRFESKGRFSAYLSQVPVYVITEAYPAFIGLSSLLRTPATSTA
ncbi:MAG: glucokinase [Burkholderiales bacterium]|nr:glucokinase [Burkholderiales bacterium]